MSLIYLNRDYVDSAAPLIHHHDCGFTTGIGIFDSMLAIKGKPQYMDDHLERIYHDAQTVIGMKPNLDDFDAIFAALVEKNNLKNGYARVRTTVTGGVVKIPLAPAKDLTVLIDVAPCQPPPKTPVKCAIISDFPRIAGCKFENCKRLDYSRSYAARRKAETIGAEEAIITNTEGNIACGATSNIFIEENGILITPPLSDGVLAGVTRKNLMKEKTVKEGSISPKRLKSADKIYLTNSFIGLREVNLI
jgi:branched-chain amino acid aminotransferase